MYLQTGYGRGFTVVPSDTVVLAKPCAGIYVGGTGDITCRLVGDTADIVFKAVPIGTVLMIKPKLIKATGTTATLMIGLSD